MAIHTLQRTQRLGRPIGEVFDFFSKPENLGRMTPEDMRFCILTPLPVEMKEGALIDYTIRLSGFPIRWTTLITAYDPPYRFVDQQIRGPYSFWHHEHVFVADGGGTLVSDAVHYMLPLGFAGEVVHRMAVRSRLENIFNHRARVLNDVFASSAPHE
jgi:ligand-binding SRPBCC domain-containing protein